MSILIKLEYKKDKEIIMDEDLVKKYINFFGDNPPFPPEHIMQSLVKMKEEGTFEKNLNAITDNELHKNFRDNIEKVSGEKMSPSHPFFDINFDINFEKDFKKFENVTFLNDIVLENENENENEDEDENYDNLSNLDFWVSMNPDDTIYADEIKYDVENMFSTFNIDTTFFVCKVPTQERTYLLFEITYNDYVYERNIINAVSGCSSHEDAKKYLLENFAENGLMNSFGGEYEEFLQGLLKRYKT